MTQESNPTFPRKAPLNTVACPNCGEQVDDRAPACPACGTKIYVETPADITPVRHDSKAKIPESQDEL